MYSVWDRMNKKLGDTFMSLVSDFDKPRRDGPERRGEMRMLRSGYAGGVGTANIARRK